MTPEEKADTKNRKLEPYLPDGSPKWHTCAGCDDLFPCETIASSLPLWPCTCSGHQLGYGFYLLYHQKCFYKACRRYPSLRVSMEHLLSMELRMQQRTENLIQNLISSAAKPRKKKKKRRSK